MEMENEYLPQFLDFLQYQRGLADNTVKSYGWDLKEYFEWVQSKGLTVNDIQVRDMDSFIIELKKNRGNSIGSVNRKIYCLRAFYRYLQRIEVVQKNPMDLFQNIREPRTLPRYLTEKQQKALIKASRVINHRPQRESWLRDRDYLMVLFFLDTGLRVGEVCKIEIQNINLGAGILRVMGKGSKEREIILSDRLVRATKGYLKAADKIVLDGTVGPGLPARGVNLVTVVKEMGIPYKTVSGAIFCNHPGSRRLEELKNYIKENIQPLPLKYLFFNQQGKPMDTRHVYRIIHEIGEKAGIENLYPHMLRHTFASTLRGKGADLLLIKEALGHSSVSTTQIYAHLGPGEYRSQMKEYIN